jgi:acetyl esterase/lipase/ubiquinone/menaquinone biosynthesis C-methylase UbiE
MNCLPLRVVLSLFAAAILAVPAPGQEKSVRPGINKPFENPDVKEYLGKFEVESREIYAKRQEIVNVCKLRPGMTVADIGAGTGLFTRLFAKAVGPDGKVYAVDIAPAFIKHIERSAAEQGLHNVSGVVATPTSVELPPASVDLAFICDTYHHFEFPFKTLQSIHRALRPGGQIVLIDFKRIPGVTSDWVLNHVRAGQETFTKEIVDSGFQVVGEAKLLTDNYLVRFQKVETAPAPPGGGTVKAFPYKRTPSGDLLLHVHFPENWKASDRRPAMVFFFGGGWTNGKVTQFEPQATYFAGRGLVTLRADYRVKSRHEVTPADCVADARSAVRWIRKHAGELGIDPERVVAAGGSAGGHIAACTFIAGAPDGSGEDLSFATKPNALVLYNPVLKFQGIDELMRRIGNDARLAQVLSPTLHLTKDTPPTLLLYGTEDRLLAQGREFSVRAKEVGNRVELYLAEGVGHGFFNRPPWQLKTTQRVDAFLQTLGYLSYAPVQ